MLYAHALHSICIFTMFHAFRCVFICWILCAARFGLGSTHDAISFSTSHVHAFFMHTYPCFSFYLFSVVIVFSVSLSLSLSLLDSQHMAPKRNPLRSRTSYSNPTSLHIQFRDEKAHKDFSENFSNRGIHLECHVVLSDFSNIALPTVIHSQGWESLCEILMRCPTVIIQEFYSNMHDFDTSIPQFAT